MAQLTNALKPRILTVLLAACLCTGCIVVKGHTPGLTAGSLYPSQSVQTQTRASFNAAPVVSEVATATKHLVSEGKPDVLLVAMFHMGDSTYYDRMQEIWDDTDVILWESFGLGEKNSAFWKAVLP